MHNPIGPLEVILFAFLAAGFIVALCGLGMAFKVPATASSIATALALGSTLAALIVTREVSG